MESYRPRTTASRGVSSRTTINEGSLPRTSRPSRSNTGLNIANASIPPSITAEGRGTVLPAESSARSTITRPSALPRSTSSSSNARLSFIASTRPSPMFAGKSPPLQALAPTSLRPSRPLLNTSQTYLSTRQPYGHSEQTLSPLDMDDDTVLGIVVPEKASTYPPAALPPRLIPELQALAASNVRPSDPASSSISSISSPSTQFTASSSPWSASTATTTPISWSSASPSIVQATSKTSKRSHTVPMPSNLKTKIPKLPVVKEVQNATSKSTMDRGTERTGRGMHHIQQHDSALPPRSSSLKRGRSRSDSAATAGSEQQAAPEIASPRIPVPHISSSASMLRNDSTQPRDASRDGPRPTRGHSRLQEVLNKQPAPGRGNVVAARSAQPSHTVDDHPRPKQLLEPLPVVQNQHRRFPSLSRRHVREPSGSDQEVQKSSARSRLAKFSKLALFGKSKESSSESKPQKLQSRKGPAAGTGHEGYGKFGRKSRKQSTSSSIGASESETSIASVSRRPTDRRQSRMSTTSQEQSDLDDFASTRMKPVVMVGGSQRGRTDPFPLLSKNPQTSNLSLNTMSSAESYPASTAFSSPRRERFPPDLSETRPSLATRRSQKFGHDEDAFRFPEPIETQGLVATPCLDSRNTTQSSELPTPADAMYRLDPTLLDKQRTKSKKMKWNLFRRKESISAAGPSSSSTQVRSGVSVDVAPAPAHRPTPWYAMIGTQQDMDTPVMIGQYLREAAESPDKEDEIISIGFSDEEVLENPYTHRESILLPSARASAAPPAPTAPAMTESVPAPLAREFPQSASSLPLRRQPRLAQVGRIPKVVPTRQQTQPGFQATHTPPSSELRPEVTMPNIEFDFSFSEAERSAMLSQAPVPAQQYVGMQPSMPFNAPQPWQHEEEFLEFSGMRNSDFTTSSESTGIISFAGPSSLLAPVPPHLQAENFGHDEDVWNEYDDFMDDIMSPVQSPPRKQKQSKVDLRNDSRVRTKAGAHASTKGLAITPSTGFSGSVSKSFLDTPPLPLSNVPSSQDLEIGSSDEIRLRRSRIAAALHASYAPSSPFSMRDFIDEYGRRGSAKFSERLSGSSAPTATPTQAVAHPLREQSRPREYENAAQLEAVERVKNPTKHSDQSYASLMVSRWLSFGRVLFSPAHQEVERNPERHILVIDGLGSEDWSIYCAVTYQNEKAYVHDLKERKYGRTKPKTNSNIESAPSNHRRSEVSSFNDKFPFPPGFFTAIVVRFPPAMPDSKLKNIVSECRRVLAPGGFLELMVLDLDIVNMGVQTRRAIKDVKIKMTSVDRAVSLKPIIDNVSTVLGSNGFANLSRCVVGVPVVGKPASSLDSSSESRSSTGSARGLSKRASTGTRPYGSLGASANFSLNDLVSDHSANADAQISKVVSKTARSWWQHCFEAGIMADGKKNKSIFANKEVLHECKSRGASFKLLIAYTQKPGVEQKRRTMSEPTVPTLATAGVPS